MKTDPIPQPPAEETEGMLPARTCSSLVLFQPVNPRYWGVLSARTIPEIVEWASGNGMIFVEREPVVFAEFHVKTHDGSPLNEHAVKMLKDQAEGIRSKAMRWEDPYLAAATGIMWRIKAGNPKRSSDDDRLRELLFHRTNAELTHPETKP